MANFLFKGRAKSGPGAGLRRNGNRSVLQYYHIALTFSGVLVESVSRIDAGMELFFGYEGILRKVKGDQMRRVEYGAQFQCIVSYQIYLYLSSIVSARLTQSNKQCVSS